MVDRIGVGTWSPSPTEFAYVKDVMESGRISYGPYSRKLEEEMAHLHGRKFGVLSNSGTSSLQVALQMMKESRGWSDGDEVIIPALTFVATANIVLHNNMVPVPVDIEPITYGMAFEEFVSAITPKTRAVIVVNLFGQPARDLARIYIAAHKMGLAVIEDSCECMFATHMNAPVGSWSDVSCFSFYVAHLLTTGVGGIALCDTQPEHDHMRSLVNHGRDIAYISIDDDNTNDPELLREIVRRRFLFDRIGHSYRVTELEAALGLAQIKDGWRLMIAKRQENARYFINELSDLESKMALPIPWSGNTHSYMMFPLVMHNESKWGIVQHLERHDIETREMVPLINQPAYGGRWNEHDYPITHWVNESGFYVGCHQDITTEQRDHIVWAIRSWFEK